MAACQHDGELDFGLKMVGLAERIPSSSADEGLFGDSYVTCFLGVLLVDS